jgi:hypothetical protein
MNLPNQSRPVLRGTSDATIKKVGVVPSSWQCSLCHLACNALPEPARTACNIACDHTVC